MLAHTFSPSTQETEADGFLWVRGQPDLHSGFHNSKDYIDYTPPKKDTEKKKKKNIQLFFYPEKVGKYNCLRSSREVLWMQLVH